MSVRLPNERAAIETTAWRGKQKELNVMLEYISGFSMVFTTDASEEDIKIEIINAMRVKVIER